MGFFDTLLKGGILFVPIRVIRSFLLPNRLSGQGALASGANRLFGNGWVKSVVVDSGPLIALLGVYYARYPCYSRTRRLKNEES